MVIIFGKETAHAKHDKHTIFAIDLISYDIRGRCEWGKICEPGEVDCPLANCGFYGDTIVADQEDRGYDVFELKFHYP